MNDRPSAFTLATLIVAGCAILFFIFKQAFDGLAFKEGETSAARANGSAAGPKFPLAPNGRDDEPPLEAGPDDDAARLARLLLALLGDIKNDPNAVGGEAVLRFKSDEAYQRFLAAADALGIKVLGRLDPLRAVRVGFDDITDLRQKLDGHKDDLDTLEGNYLFANPTPAPEIDTDRAGGPLTGFGDSLLAALGITGSGNLGAGIKIALLDSGVRSHPALNGARLTAIDLVDPDGANAFVDTDGHGTAMASLLAGRDSRIQSLAPGADITSIRVLGEGGVGDAFTIASGITTAVDRGATVISMSLGSYSDSPILADAVAYAVSRGAVVVASSGNDQATRATYPAAYAGVISVGASDANNRLATFSNADPSLHFAAPGVGIYSAYGTDGVGVIDGTSPATAIMAGLIADVAAARNISTAQAADLLAATANEAGPPGRDAYFGAGVPSYSRALQWEAGNHSNLAVVSPFLDRDNTYGYGENQLLFMVENRGTVRENNINVSTNSNGRNDSRIINTIDPAAHAVVPLPFDAAAFDRGETLTYQVSTPVRNTQDGQHSDNNLSITLTKPPAAQDQAR